MLARVMQERMKRVSSTEEPLDFGQIREDYSLLLNKFPIPIPRDQYFVIGQTVKRGDRVLVAWVDADAVVIGVLRTAREAVT